MNQPHTPGPWLVESLFPPKYIKTTHVVLAKVGIYPSTVCTVEEYNEIPNFEPDRLADARLIAAAPDMLQVLQELEESSEYWSEYFVPLGIVERIHAAIAKATGPKEPAP